MLVLSRQENQVVVFGDRYQLSVARILRKDVGVVVRNLGDSSERPMLLRLGDQADLDNEIHVRLVDIVINPTERKVRLGINAPRTMPIYRQELLPSGGSP